MASQETRALHISYARERAAAKRNFEKQQAELALNYLRARVPEQLPKKYVLIMTDEKGREASRYASHNLSQFQAHTGLGLDALREMIDTGMARTVYGGHIKIVPAGADVDNGPEDPAVEMFLELGRRATG